MQNKKTDQIIESSKTFSFCVYVNTSIECKYICLFILVPYHNLTTKIFIIFKMLVSFNPFIYSSMYPGESFDYNVSHLLLFIF